MKFETDVTKSPSTEALRQMINSPAFGERLIGRLDAEAIPGLEDMCPAERARGHVHMLSAESTGNLACQVRLGGINVTEDRNFGVAVEIIASTYQEAIEAMLPEGTTMDLFVAVLPVGDDPSEVLIQDIEGKFEVSASDHTD